MNNDEQDKSTIVTFEDNVLHMCTETDIGDEHAVLQILRLLLDPINEAVVFTTLSGGETMLHRLAIKHGDTDEFEAIIQLMKASCGGDGEKWTGFLSKKDDMGYNVVSREDVSKPRKIILRKYGARTNSLDSFVEYDGPIDHLQRLIFVYLLKEGKDLDNGRFKTIIMLLERRDVDQRRINVFSIDSKGRTILHKLAAIRGNEDNFKKTFHALKRFISTRDKSEEQRVWISYLFALDVDNKTAAEYAGNHKRQAYIELEMGKIIKN
jgi:hypothetical protein